jgi:hypothetical protein
MYYGNEVRDFNLVPKAQNVTVSEKEQELGIGLIVRLTFGGFRPRITKTNIAFEYWRRRMRKQSEETLIATAPAMLVVRVRLSWKLMTCLNVCLLSFGPTSPGHFDALADVVPLGQKALIRLRAAAVHSTT